MTDGGVLFMRGLQDTIQAGKQGTIIIMLLCIPFTIITSSENFQIQVLQVEDI